MKKCHSCKCSDVKLIEIPFNNKLYYRCELCSAPTAETFIYNKGFPTESQHAIVGPILSHINWLTHQILKELKQKSEGQKLIERLEAEAAGAKLLKEFNYEKECELIARERANIEAIDALTRGRAE